MKSTSDRADTTESLDLRCKDFRQGVLRKNRNNADNRNFCFFRVFPSRPFHQGPLEDCPIDEGERRGIRTQGGFGSTQRRVFMQRGEGNAIQEE